MKLLYFDMAGRAEMIRLAFHVGGVDFEDERVPRDQWPVVKPTTPRGQVPTLTLDDGTVLTESGALLRYAGAIGCPRLYPEDPLAAARVDEVGDVINGMAGALVAAVHQPPEVTVTQVTALLAPGGTFVNLEHVASPTAGLHAEFLGALGVPVAEDDPSNQLAPVAPQLAMLADAGLADVDCFWKWREMALLAGRKPPSDAA